jgi:hypothetical protein
MTLSRMTFAVGTLGGCLFVAALLLFDIGGLGTLIARDHAAGLVLAMLLLQIGGMFGIAVWVSSAGGGDAPPQGHPAKLKPALATHRLQSPNR